MKKGVSELKKRGLENPKEKNIYMCGIATYCLVATAGRWELLDDFSRFTNAS